MSVSGPAAATGDTDGLAGLPADDAIPALVAAHGDMIYSLGLRLCGSSDAAEDLVQETFLRALRAWDGFEGRSKASTWLYTIASRACRRMQRRKAGEPRRLEPLHRLLPSGDEAVVEIPSSDDPERDAVVGEAARNVRRAIASLPLAFRLPLVLKEVAGFSVSEIAQVLGIREATVKTRLHRARLRVRRELAGGLPSRPARPQDHEREDCLLLLKAKQEALDRDAPFPIPEAQLCARCRSVFRTLDLARDACSTLGEGTMPPEVRAALARELERGRSRPA